VLGYSQVHLRTLSILFAPECRPFWQIDILQEAWGCEYLYLTLVALGNIHRAALMTASEDEGDQANGLDLKITAVQLYIQALEGLAMNLDEAKQTPVFLVAALCLMAYFEVCSIRTATVLVLKISPSSYCLKLMHDNQVFQWQHSRLYRPHSGCGPLLHDLAAS
jgi:hypothetical protein